MSNLFRGLKPKTKLSRNGFDLSQKHVFTTRPGQIVPCLFVETVPNDHIEINMANLTRTMTLNTAAFIRGKFNFDFYFVPYTQLWHPFNQFINQRNDKHSANQKGSLYCPTISLKQLLYLVYLSLDELYDQGVRTIGQNADDVHGYNWGMNTLRLLDMCGYGSFYQLLELVREGSELAVINAYINSFANIYVNVFRIAAYQHIWYDIYRNKYFDVEDEYVGGSVQEHDYVRYFNFDDIDCGTLADSRIGFEETAQNNDRIFGLFAQRYVQYKKDIFTSLMPSTQFGSVSSVSFHDVAIGADFNNENLSAQEGSFGLTGQQTASGLDSSRLGFGLTNPSRMTDIFDIPNAFDVLQLRKAEVLQKWKQLTLRAGNMVDDNFEAHFGKTPRYESDENVLYLGSHSAPLQVNPVEQTAPSGNFKVGELGATGTSVASGQKIIFDLGEHGDFGVIVCMCYFTPENEYNATGIDKANTLYEQFDFLTPELENIGLEAVSRGLYDFSTNPSHRNDTLGFAPMYWMYKTALDKVHGQFIDDSNIEHNTLMPWVAPRHEVFYDDDVDLKLGTRGLSTFYVVPSQLNNVFGVSISNDDIDGQSQDRDPFLHNCFFDIKAVRPISVLGLPQF